MELLLNYTHEFEQALKKFSTVEQDDIAKQINRYTEQLLDNRLEFYTQTYQPQPVALVDGLDSSLYGLSINHQLALIATVDEDPIFDQTIFTLISVVNHDDLPNVFNSIVSDLYQSTLIADVSPERATEIPKAA